MGPWTRALVRTVAGAALFVVAMVGAAGVGGAQQPGRVLVDDPYRPIGVSGASANRWLDGSTEVWVIEGDVEIRQGGARLRADRATLWIDRNHRASGVHRMLAYLEGQVAIVGVGADVPAAGSLPWWLGHFSTEAELRVAVDFDAGRPNPLPPLFFRADLRRAPQVDEMVQPAQFRGEYGNWTRTPQPVPPAPPTREAAPGIPRVPQGGFPAEPVPGTLTVPRGTPLAPVVPSPADVPVPPPIVSPPVPTRRVRIFSRSDQRIQVEWLVDEATNRSVGVINAGANLIIDNLPDYQGLPLGTLDIAADRVVIWTANVLELNERQEALQLQDIELELYMEGNIVFRQDGRVIYADRLYYDVSRQIGKVVDADIRIPIPTFEGMLRLRADVVRQAGPHKLFADSAYATSSRLGVPRYRMQARSIEFQDIGRPLQDNVSGATAIDTRTGEPLVAHDRLLVSRNNFLYLWNVPVFYWPTFATDVEEPTFYVRQLTLKNDGIFGQQILTEWNMYQLLGIQDRPEDSVWNLSLDYLSRRGFGHGTTFLYSGEEFLGLPGYSAGAADFWGIRDHGTDNLGLGRRDLAPEADYRGRLFWQHRQLLQDGYLLQAEVGWQSDRNFLEQYMENEWYTLKDQETRLALFQGRDNMSWNILGQIRVNEFHTETEWLPRADHFLLGQDLLDGFLTWNQHTYGGYGRFRTTDRPRNPQQEALWEYLPWEVGPTGDPLKLGGIVFSTKHELQAPMQAGPVKVVPYALGQFDYWGEDQTGGDLNRVVGQVGVRASLPVWRVDPTVRSQLFNLNGLTHKINFDMDFFIADANQDLEQVPLYNPLDDNSIEAFRRMYTVTTFGGDIPERFDPRYYALRSGMQSWVTFPSSEIADDLTVLRLGMRNRWQTKRGMPGQQNIVDWITFDTSMNLYPNANRDNFGTAAGLLDYDFRWHVGDRLTLLSSGVFDFFADGQRIVRVGGFLNKSPRGTLYVGMDLLEGPFSSNFLNIAYNYQLSEKWITSLGMTYDLAEDRNVGEQIGITRVGESFLVHFGLTFDSTRDNFGVQFAIEPRFMANRLGSIGGTRIPLAGAHRLE